MPTAIQIMERLNSSLDILLSVISGNSSEGIAPSPQSSEKKRTSADNAISQNILENMATVASVSSQIPFTPTSVGTSTMTFQVSADQHSSYYESESSTQNAQDRIIDWRPTHPRLCAFHDCVSLASAWGLGPPTTSLEPRPTGASQAHSPSEDDNGDGKSNDLLSSCPAFRNELGDEPIRYVALTRSAVETSHHLSIINIPEHETWLCEQTAAEAGILEDVSNVYLGGRLCAARQPKIVIEPQDIGSYYYRHCFVGRQHHNFFGVDENYGPIAVSMVRETAERVEDGVIQPLSIYRMIIRISDLRIFRVAVPEEVVTDGVEQKSIRALMRDLLEIVCPQIQFSCLRPATSNRIEELLTKIDEQPIYTRYKVGVMYCGEGQSTEEEMYNNEHGSPLFEEFLDFLGQRIRLKCFDQYKGGLDVRGDTTGTHSIYAEYQAHEIMFHVSTMLPFTPSNKQQLARKRHIGNDMVTIIFQEPGAQPFTPITVRSHFQHVFIIVRANPRNSGEDATYTVAVSRAKDVPSFGPPIPRGATFQKCTEFHDFLLTKIINAENAVHRSKKFATMAARARREALKELAENFVAAHPNEGPSRIASRFLGGSMKRKERIQPKPQLGECLRGALSWLVDVHEYTMNQRITCILGVSAETLVLLEIPTGIVIFTTSTHSIIGWANTDMGLKIYYDHGQMLLLRCCTTDGSDTELTTLLRRLECVTKGVEAKEIVHHKGKKTNDLGFHLQEEGVVTDVEMYQTAWKSGLRQGSRLVEIEGKPVITLCYEEICEILANNITLRLVMIPPALDGSPRRGCEDPNCPAIKGDGNIMLTPDTFAKQPVSYYDMLNRNKRKQEEDRLFACGTETKAANKRPLDLNKSPSSVKQNNRIIQAIYADCSENISADFTDDCCLKSFDSQIKEDHLVDSDEIPSTKDLCELKELPNANLPCDVIKQNEKDEGSQSCTNANSIKLGKYHLRLQKLMQEKKNLELIVEQLRAELAEERKSHEMTKRDLDMLKNRLASSSLGAV